VGVVWVNVLEYGFLKSFIMVAESGFHVAHLCLFEDGEVTQVVDSLPRSVRPGDQTQVLSKKKKC
jgi:hypothetical protein